MLSFAMSVFPTLKLPKPSYVRTFNPAMVIAALLGLWTVTSIASFAKAQELDLQWMDPTLQHSPRMAMQMVAQMDAGQMLLPSAYSFDHDPRDGGDRTIDGYVRTSAATAQNGLYSPGAGWVSSLVLPGSAQLVDKKWGRGALYLGVEIAVWAIYASNESNARKGERAYERFANQQWSVVKYAQWILDYHEAHGLSNPYLSDLQQQVNGLQPAFDIQTDWARVPIELLRNVERNTLYVYGTQRGANNFSHVMPDYGSQQYYELVSKYYQYGPGWSDFDPTDVFLPWNGSEMSPFFYEGRDQAQAFNDHYRTASSMLSIVILNHVISAFDSFFSRQLAQARLELAAPSTPSEVATLRLHF